MATSDALEEVPDSTDWLQTPIPGLATLDNALRCQVCKDFYRTPMLTSCNHTFCSVCIRRALSNDGKCPLCRASEQEMKLRSNWAVEESVDAFVNARPALLAFARATQSKNSKVSRSPKRKRDRSSYDPDVVIDDSIDGSDEEYDPSASRSRKRLRSSARQSKTRGARAADDVVRLEASQHSVSVNLVDHEEAGAPEPEPEPELDDGLVACPICSQRMKEVQVSQHLDTTCPGEFQPQPTPSVAPTTASRLQRPEPSNKPRPERLPAIHYSMLKEPQLRKRLQEQGLSTNGSRAMLERRHKEWLTIWNANCDSLRPRPKRELLRDLDAWERTQGSRASTVSRAAHQGTQIRDKDFDGTAWATEHNSSFKDLIANARKSRSKAEPKADNDHDSIGDESRQKQQESGDRDTPNNISEPRQQPNGEGVGGADTPRRSGASPSTIERPPLDS